MTPVFSGLRIRSSESRSQRRSRSTEHMVAHVVADLRDLHLLIEREQHTEALNRVAHRAKASKVAVAALMIFLVDAPVRGNPSTHATKRVHLASVASSSPAKNAAPQ